MKDIVCLYHANCMDGMGSALALYERFGGERVEFVPCSHGKGIPDVSFKDRYVVIVDFSFSETNLISLVTTHEARSVLVLDHHVSAQRDLEGFPDIAWGDDEYRRGIDPTYLLPNEGIHVHFDMNLSGAQITWGYFHACIPPMIGYIGDRDLWKFKRKHSREINEGLSLVLKRSHEYLEDWSALKLNWNHSGNIEDLYQSGRTILSYQQQIIDDIVAQAKETEFCGEKVLAVNCPHQFASDVGAVLAKGRPFSICYSIVGSGVGVSLRSDNDDPNSRDVSLIAEANGGGGHKHAAGFGFKLPEGMRGII